MGIVGPPSPRSPSRLDRPAPEDLLLRLLPALAPGGDWDLGKMRAALSALGDPHLAYPTVHVGGTNGKGSVTAMVASVLRETGLRDGCYTSPHLCTFRERILVEGSMVPEDALVRHAAAIRDLVVEHELTFFEASTLLAFRTFAAEGVEAASVEVGLGGRLDATNVVQPAVAAVTNVALDHAEYLGATLPEIAREKAGIAKAGVPFVTAQEPGPALDVLLEVAGAAGAPVTVVSAGEAEGVAVSRAGTSFRCATDAWGDLEIRLPLVGRHQAVNALVALRVLERLPPGLLPPADAVLAGLAGVSHRGRDELVVADGVTWLLDIAHNAAGMASLAETMDAVDLPRPRVALVGVLADKDWSGMLPPLLGRVDEAVLTVPLDAPEGRRWDPGAAAETLAAATPVRVVTDFAEALGQARASAAGGTVVVTGSAFMVGGAMRALGLAPLG